MPNLKQVYELKEKFFDLENQEKKVLDYLENKHIKVEVIKYA